VSWYVTETLPIKIAAFDPVTKNALSDYSCTVDFFAPPKSPQFVPSDRVPDSTYSAIFDTDQQAFAVDVSTVGWAPGHWYFRVTLTGARTAVSFNSVNLLA
jgi:hypothetical protein